MKYLNTVLVLFMLASCSVKTETTESKSESASDNEKLEVYFEKLLNKKVTATVYIVHPEVCGACSNAFLVKMSHKDLNSKFYLLATGEFKKEHQEAADKIKNKIRFVDAQQLGRLGLNTQFPQKIVLNKGGITSVETIKI